MSCSDVEPHLDAFIDTELPPRELVEVARHVAQCAACDESVQRLMSLHDVVAGVTVAEAEHVDPRAVWARLEVAMGEHETRQKWRARRRVAPLWVTGMAMAAGALLALRAVVPVGPGPVQGPIASVNSVEIVSVSGRDIHVRHEPTRGNTIIWVDDGAKTSHR